MERNLCAAPKQMLIGQLLNYAICQAHLRYNHLLRSAPLHQ
jgi:hypothetical protein